MSSDRKLVPGATLWSLRSRRICGFQPAVTVISTTIHGKDDRVRVNYDEHEAGCTVTGLSTSLGRFNKRCGKWSRKPGFTVKVSSSMTPVDMHDRLKIERKKQRISMFTYKKDD
ncbi:hypothetical protein ACFL2C_04335 [Patescibacteria group bacterium]